MTLIVAASVARTNFAGYIPSEETLFQSHQYVGATHLQNVSSDYPQREVRISLPKKFKLV